MNTHADPPISMTRPYLLAATDSEPAKRFYDVIVIGSGIAGLTAAVGAARKWKVALIEQKCCVTQPPSWPRAASPPPSASRTHRGCISRTRSAREPVSKRGGGQHPGQRRPRRGCASY